MFRDAAGRVCRVGAEITDPDGWTLDDYDPLTERSVWSTLDSEGNLIKRVDQPVDQLLAANMAERNASAGARFGNGWTKIASIPADMYWDALDAADLQEDHKYIRGFLADNPALKTFEKSL